MALAKSKTGGIATERGHCELCGKDVAKLPNGRLRYHSCVPQMPAAQAEPKEVIVAEQTAVVEAEDESQEEASEELEAMLDEDQAQGDAVGEESQEAPEDEAPQEISAEGATVEEATPGKPKRERKAKEPKAPTERKVPESIVRARAERAALAERANPIIKVSGTGENAKATAHLYDPDADRTLCGATVPANEEARTAQGWHESVTVGKQVAVEPTSCDTCSARMAKLTSTGPIRRRASRKAGDAEVGDVMAKATKGKTVYHLANALAVEPERTLCGAIIGSEPEGWTQAGQGVEADCPTCNARSIKLLARAG